MYMNICATTANLFFFCGIINILQILTSYLLVMTGPKYGNAELRYSMQFLIHLESL